MDAWAKSQRRPLPGSGTVSSSSPTPPPNNTNENNNSNTNNNEKVQQQHHQTQNNHHQKQLQLHPQQQLTTTQRQHHSQLPLGAAAQRAHRIHTSLVKMYKSTNDPHLAPSTISYNAAINAWSKSYHPSAGEMAELLLGEMIREWRFGYRVGLEENEEIMDDENDDDDDDDVVKKPKGKLRRGNERVKPDVVTFTAV